MAEQKGGEEMVEKNIYALTFISNSKEQIRFNIPRAQKALSPAFARQCMDNIIGTGIVLTAQGRPTDVSGLELISTELTRVV
jgi:hypothetical protein